jgi:hypothetical protein
MHLFNISTSLTSISPLSVSICVMTSLPCWMQCRRGYTCLSQRWMTL